MLNKVIKFVDDSFGLKKPHFGQTIYWMPKLNPKADESMQVAAYAHDVDRAFNEPDFPKYQQGLSMIDSNAKLIHQKESAEIIKEFLQKESYDNDKINKIYFLVLHHEEGGDTDSNLLMDADSISYLETVANKHVEWVTKGVGFENIKIKLDYMYNRITSAIAKKYAKPFYDNSIKYLNQLKEKNVK